MPLASLVSMGSALTKVTPSPSLEASALACSMSLVSRAIGLPASTLAPSPLAAFIISMVSALMVMLWTRVPLPSALTFTRVSKLMQPAVGSASRGRIASGRKRMGVSFERMRRFPARGNGPYTRWAAGTPRVLRCPPPGR